jgi:hypothetical protein
MLLRNSYIGSTMMMKADIYEQENTQDLTTGTLTRHWEFKNTVNCQIQPTKSDGGSTKTDGKKYNTNSNTYSESSQLRGKFLVPLSKRWRVSNIRSSDNKLIYLEMDTTSQNATIYEVVACHAMTDPFGKLSHYDVKLERVNIQNNDSF